MPDEIPKNSKAPNIPRIKPSVFPQSLLNQINENSQGGFVLLYIDSQGLIQPVIQADNQAIQLGLVKFAGNLLMGIDNMNASDLRGEMIMGIDPEDFDDEDFEE